MNRNSKALVLALSAALALSGPAASAAFAEAPEFHAEEAPVTYHGEQVETKKLTVNSGTVACKTATLEGTSSSTATTELEVSAAYSGCTAFESEAKWAMNGCTYRWTMRPGFATSYTDIICPAGKEITVTTASCVVHIPPQNFIEHVLWSNQGGGGPLLHITATIEETGITYTETTGCVLPGKHTNGSVKGKETIVGENSESEPEGIWVE